MASRTSASQTKAEIGILGTAGGVGGGWGLGVGGSERRAERKRSTTSEATPPFKTAPDCESVVAMPRALRYFSTAVTRVWRSIVAAEAGALFGAAAANCAGGISNASSGFRTA